MLLALSWPSSKGNSRGVPAFLPQNFCFWAVPRMPKELTPTWRRLPHKKYVPVEPGEPCWSHSKAVVGISLGWCPLQVPSFFGPGLLIQALEFLPCVVPTFPRMAFQKRGPGWKWWEDNPGKAKEEMCFCPRVVVQTLTQAGLPGEGITAFFSSFSKEPGFSLFWEKV